MTETEVRRDLVRVARRLDARGILTATDGNLSARLPGGRILITPAGCCKGTVEPGDLVVVSLDGRTEPDGRPSSELPLHRTIYENRADIGAVVHAHPPYATAYAVAGIPLDRPILSEAILVLGDVPVVPYATPGGEALGRQVATRLNGTRALLLANHGAVSFGVSIDEAGARMECLEQVARIDWLSRFLGPREIGVDQVRELIAMRDGVRESS
ncbi:MAG TPA: class II aldolase/adducin family protein [Thermoanaerobaculia bacterium]|nr:class II aldolase/adducin family protein [Thermoanaerobaculia bacterium]